MMNDTEGLLFRVWVFLNHFDQVSGGVVGLPRMQVMLHIAKNF